ncbi:MAG: hypothetical protein HQL82_03670 [Magnetococcales bacterium]|nr:hypothetical protein [Magnetococcales bacterium]
MRNRSPASRNQSVAPIDSGGAFLRRGVCRILRQARGSRTHALWPALILALAGALHLLWVTQPHGPGLTPDSAYYLAGADGVRAGQGIQDFQGRPLYSWPPLYPVVLALTTQALGADPVDAALFMNVLLYGTVLFLVGRWLLRQVTDRWLVLVGLLLLGLAFPSFDAAKYVLSESVFHLFLWLFLLGMGGWLHACRNPGASVIAVWPLLLAGVGAAGANMTRLIGLVLLLVGPAILLLAGGAIPWRRRWGHGLLFLATGATPFLLWAIHNKMVHGRYLQTRGYNEQLPVALMERLREVTITLSNWLVPHWVSHGIGMLLLTVATGMILVWGMKRSQENGLLRLQEAAVLPLAVFPPLYLGGVIAAASIFGTDPIGDRFLMPLYAPLLLLALKAGDGLLPRNGLWRRGVGVGLLVWSAVVPAQWTLAVDGLERQRGIGSSPYFFSRQEWRDSALIDHLRRQPPPGVLYSNVPDVLYALVGRSALLSPRKQDQARDAQVAHMIARVCAGESLHLIWFNRNLRINMAVPDRLRGPLGLQEVVRSADGSLFELHPPCPRRLTPKDVPPLVFYGW